MFTKKNTESLNRKYFISNKQYALQSKYCNMKPNYLNIQSRKA